MVELIKDRSVFKNAPSRVAVMDLINDINKVTYKRKRVVTIIFRHTKSICHCGKEIYKQLKV